MPGYYVDCNMIFFFNAYIRYKTYILTLYFMKVYDGKRNKSGL